MADTDPIPAAVQLAGQEAPTQDAQVQGPIPRIYDPTMDSQQQPQNAQQQATADYPRPGMPAIIRMISDINHAGEPGHPGTRLEGFENFLGNFLGALGQGLSASGTGPGANF